jgi:hypothetical protein
LPIKIKLLDMSESPFCTGHFAISSSIEFFLLEVVLCN